MTMWSPELPPDARPMYVAIAEVLERDIAAGRLQAGQRLPTHRELARALGVTTGTVTRAYEEAHRRGLVTGQVGRGTFVLTGSDASVGEMPVPAGPELLDLSFNGPPLGPARESIREGLRALAAAGDLEALLQYTGDAPLESHVAAAAQWLKRCGVRARPAEITITCGAQHAMFLCLAATCEPGDLVLTESLTFPGIKTLAAMLHLRLEGVPLDGGGLDARALEELCGKHAPRALYCMPNLQNPTATVMPEARRRAVAQVAARHDLLLIEDDTYGFLLRECPPALATLAPEHTLHISSFSKCVAPGLRIGWVRAPAARTEALRAALLTSTIMPATLMAALAARLVETGDVATIIRARRRETRRRGALAREILGAWIPDSCNPACEHLWLALPEAWSCAALVDAARRRGVAVAPAGMFAVGSRQPPEAVRLSLGVVPGLSDLRRALEILRGILARNPTHVFGV